MYLSLKKKIFYIVFALFVIMATLFLSIFILIYAEKYSSDFDVVSKRNQYVMGLLNENIILQRQLDSVHVKVSPIVENNISDKQRALTLEAKINDQMQKNFNQQSQAFIAGMKILGISSLLSLISVLVFGFMLQRLVIVPIDKLTSAAKKVSSGDFSYRIPIQKKQRFFDEIDTLAATFNGMLSNIEHNIGEIKNSERFLQALIDAIPDAIRVVDHNHNIVMFNKAYKKQFVTGEICGKCYQAYGYDKPCPFGSFSCPLREIRSAKASSISMVHTLENKPLSINAAPLRIIDAKGCEDFYIIESIRDLSDDIRFSHQQKISSLGFLATSVAHEMKNNLGSVRMILEALIEGLEPDKKISTQDIKYLQMIYEQIVACVAIPERLLKLSKNNPETMELFDVKNAIEEVLSLLDYEAKRNGIVIKTEFKTTENKISGNSADFKMIILNLVQNAIKAMPSGGDLTICTGKDKNFVTLDVQDTGTGIDPERLGHIFEPFYSQGQSNRQQGTGLGLAIVKSLIEKYHGQIKVLSRLSQGTTFKIRLPRPKK